MSSPSRTLGAAKKQTRRARKDSMQQLARRLGVYPVEFTLTRP